MHTKCLRAFTALYETNSFSIFLKLYTHSSNHILFIKLPFTIWSHVTCKKFTWSPFSTFHFAKIYKLKIMCFNLSTVDSNYNLFIKASRFIYNSTEKFYWIYNFFVVVCLFSFHSIISLSVSHYISDNILIFEILI